jgi:hypothetical protein
MATIDLSRSATDFRKHYKSVRAQQGRVFVDDDYNENERLHGEDDRRARVDIIGPAGTPDSGFLITNPHLTGNKIDFDITAGTFYLGGLHLELDQNESFQVQSDWVQFSGGALPAPPNAGKRFDLVYLESWLQPVSAVEDNELFEVALSGPDTSTRMRVMRRVRAATGTATGDCRVDWKTVIDGWAANNLGTMNNQNERVPNTKLKVEFEAGTDPADLCSPPVAGGYLGAENQAIRVQLTDATHFTWGFDNAAPLYRVQVSNNGAGQRRVITMLTEPKDQAHWPLSGQVVELLPWSAVLANNEKLAERGGMLTRVDASFDPDTKVLTLANDVPNAFGAGWKTRPDAAQLGTEFFYLRVWNRGSDTVSPPEIPFVTGTAVTLGQTGLKITISGADRQPNDHWIIAARPESPNRVVPWLLEAGRSPHGFRRFFAPLAVIEWSVNAGVVTGTVIHDCRETFPPLTRLRGCCTFTVGDGTTSFGIFTRIQDAIDHLPAKGGEVCVLPGNYEENVRIAGRRNITIKGCGTRSRVFSPAAQPRPVIHVEESQNITIQSLLVEASATGIGILLRGRPAQVVSIEDDLGNDAPVLNITLENLLVRAATRCAIEAQTAYGVTIRHCRIEMKDVATAYPAIFFIGEDSLIEENVIVVADEERRVNGLEWINPLDPDYAAAANAAIGGLHLGGTCERIRVINNVIARGIGNGITLGSIEVVTKTTGQRLPQQPEPKRDPCYPCKRGNTTVPDPPDITINTTQSEGDLYEILIERNRIFNMGLNGIGVIGFFPLDKVDEFITVHQLLIEGNEIRRCLNRQLDDITPGNIDSIGYGGVALADAEGLIIRDNIISDNGPDFREPICGIFVLHGEGIEISRNHIMNNGAKPVNSAQTSGSVKRGRRGGINIVFAVAPTVPISMFNVTVPVHGGFPALKVHDNVVTVPVGQALSVTALGPVSVLANQFTSRGMSFENAATFIASTVAILNLGISNEFYLQLFLFAMLKNGNVNAVSQGRPGLDDGGLGISLTNGNVLFNDNQCSLDLMETGFSLSISSILILSLDDIGFQNNQCECNLLDDFVIAHAILFAISVRASDNRFKESSLLTERQKNVGLPFSAITLGLFNTTTDNQSTHCLWIMGHPNLTVDHSNVSLNMIDNPTACCRLLIHKEQCFGRAKYGTSSIAIDNR